MRCTVASKAAFAATLLLSIHSSAHQLQSNGDMHRPAEDSGASVSYFREAMSSVRSSIYAEPTPENSPRTPEGTEEYAGKSNADAGMEASKRAVDHKFELDPQLLESKGGVEVTRIDKVTTQLNKERTPLDMTTSSQGLDERGGSSYIPQFSSHGFRYSPMELTNDIVAPESSLSEFAQSHSESTLTTAVLPRTETNAAEADLQGEPESTGIAFLKPHKKPGKPKGNPFKPKSKPPKSTHATQQTPTNKSGPTKSSLSSVKHTNSDSASATSSGSKISGGSETTAGSNTAPKSETGDAAGGAPSSPVSASYCKTKATATQCAVFCPASSVGGQSGSHSGTHGAVLPHTKSKRKQGTAKASAKTHTSTTGSKKGQTKGSPTSACKSSTTCFTTTGCGVKPTTTHLGTGYPAGSRSCPKNAFLDMTNGDLVDDRVGGENLPLSAMSNVSGSGSGASPTSKPHSGGLGGHSSTPAAASHKTKSGNKSTKGAV